jgi:putative flippase GtrA
MVQLHIYIKETILKVVDFFYPPFKKFLPVQTFRYAACGGANMLFDICLFAISYNFIFQKQNVHIGNLTISPYIAAFLTAFCISFPTGFYLSRYVVFQQSSIRGRIQLVRYFIVVMVCFFLNYIFLKLFVEYFGWYPTPSKIVTTVIVVVFSFISQTYFSFGTGRKAPAEQGA